MIAERAAARYNASTMADSFRVTGLGGKKSLNGSIAVSGAKNAVLPAMASSILFDDELRLLNVPDIEDVSRMCELMTSVGILAQHDLHECRLSASGLHSPSLDDAIGKRFRASIILAGPLLARFGKVEFSHPGGDVIGPRPINLFLEGFEKMGAKVSEQGGRYSIAAAGGSLKGGDIFFPYITVTGTETLLLAAVLGQGTTTLRNAAMEPEIPDLAAYLNACGADIKGAGTPTIVIHGGKPLRAKGKAYRIPPDRIEAGSFLILGALAADSLDVTDCEPEHIAILIDLLLRSGVPITVSKDMVSIRSNGKTPNRKFKGFTLRTHEYPGFATDLQAPMVTYLTQVDGESLVFETIFEGRLNYTEDLVKMGADITVFDPHRVLVKGPSALLGRELESPDVRAGLAFIIAATVAKGKSIINNVYHIDRGYERIEKRLQNIGVSIERVSTL